jgi:hypothetical protein
MVTAAKRIALNSTGQRVTEVKKNRIKGQKLKGRVRYDVACPIPV